MAWIFANSAQHYTTSAQAEDKVAYSRNAVTASAGAFGQPGIRPNADDAGGEMMNFAAQTVVVLQAHLILTAQYGVLVHFRNGDPGGPQCSLEIRSDGSIGFYRGPNASGGGTFLAQSAAAEFQFNVQHSFRCEVGFNDATGYILIHIDGREVLNATGLDTTASSLDDTCTQIRLYSGGSINFAAGYWSHIAIGDDPADADGYQPRVSAMFPTADGADETGAQTGGSAGDAFSVVDETTPDDSDYLEHDAGERNSFEFGDPPANLAAVYAVQSVARVFKTDADVVTARPYVTIGGTRYYGDTVEVPADVAYLTYMWNENPATAAAWAPSDITAPIEVGWERVT